VDEEDEQPGDRQQREDRGLRIGPEAGDVDVARMTPQLTIRTTRS
jgi:hypothetical protein